MRSDRYKHEAPKKKKKHRPLKVLLFLILFLAAAVAAAAAYSYKTTSESIALTFTDDSPTVEFGSSCPVMDYIAESEGEVTAGADLLDTASTGAHTMVYTVTKPVLGGIIDTSKEFTLEYTVADTVPPLMIWSGDGTVLERGADLDISNIIAYGDNADPEPDVDVKGKVDMDTAGEYPLNVTITDASGNSTDWDLTITVVDELPASEDTAERTSFSDFTSAYKGKGRSFGIDVSAWQDDIDFDAVKDAGCEFVMIRIGYGTGDDIEIDKQFYSNIKNARAAGLKTGVYLYSYDNIEENARLSADWVIKMLDGEQLDLPVAYDWEDFTAFQTYGMSFYDLNKLYDSFSEELAEAGYDCMLYGSKNYLEKIWTGTDKRTVWLAHYTEKTDYESPYMMWQASCTGKIDGIDGDVDLDILYE